MFMNFIIILLLLTALVTIAAKASLKLFLVTGTVFGKNGQLVKLVRDHYGQSPEILGSKMILNNQFRISCKVDKVSPVSIVFGEGKKMMVYTLILEEGHISFFLDKNGRKEVKGGKYNQLLMCD
jgi:hypothetical protein